METVDDETLAKYAEEGLKQPDNFGRHVDLGQYETHAPIAAVAHNADDVRAESNMAALVAILNEAGCQDDDFYVAGERHWAFGPIETLYIRVRDDAGQFTRAWREAVSCAEYLKNEYPVLDEKDCSARELERLNASVDEALQDCARQHDDDADEDEFICDLARCWYTKRCSDYYEVEYKLVDEVYAEAREQYFDGRARTFLIETAAAEREILAAGYDGTVLDTGE